MGIDTPQCVRTEHTSQSSLLFWLTVVHNARRLVECCHTLYAEAWRGHASPHMPYLVVKYAQLIPVGAVQALVNVQLLNKIPPFHQLLDIQFTNALIISILPGTPPLSNRLALALAWR